jgi:hypothetical protein
MLYYSTSALDSAPNASTLLCRWLMLFWRLCFLSSLLFSALSLSGCVLLGGWLLVSSFPCLLHTSRSTTCCSSLLHCKVVALAVVIVVLVGCCSSSPTTITQPVHTTRDQIALLVTPLTSLTPPHPPLVLWRPFALAQLLETSTSTDSTDSL